MSVEYRALTENELDAVGDVVNGGSGGIGLSRLLSAEGHIGTLAVALFRGSTILKRAALANLLARLKRAPVADADVRAAERAIAAIGVLERSTNATRSAASLGNYAADFIIGPVLRGDRAPDHELEALFAGYPGNIRTTLEAARASCVLDEVMLTYIAARELGRDIRLSDVFDAVATVLDGAVAVGRRSKPRESVSKLEC
jgi:hypothetical protein